MQFKLKVKNNTTGDESICSGEFTALEWQVLSDFQKYSNEILTAEML